MNGNLRFEVLAPLAGQMRPSRTPLAEHVSHYGIGPIEDLAVNIGRFALQGFSFDSATVPRLVAALQVADGYDALVLDLRANGGGNSAMAALVASHFVGADTVPLLAATDRDGRRTIRYSTASLPGPRMENIPLIVVTSRLTSDAAEELAFSLQRLGRATVVGKPTRGAGSTARFVDLGGGFEVAIPVARLSDPRTAIEMTSAGVTPDIEADTNVAISVAIRLAASRLADILPARAQLMQSVAEYSDARANPLSIDSATIASYAGRYEGGRQVWAAGSTIAYSNGPGSNIEVLTALDRSTFAMHNGFTVSFGRDADGTMLLRGPWNYQYRLYARLP